MKTIVLASASAFVLSASVVAAEEANGISWGAEIDGNYDTGTEVFTLTATPEMVYTMDRFTFTTSSVLDLNADQDANEEVFNGIDFELAYEMTKETEAYVRISTDDEFDFGDAVVGATFKF